jgi:hypothetical protein
MSLFSDVFSLPVHFEFFAIFSYCLHFAKFVCLLKELQRLKQGWQKSPAGDQANIRQKLGLVWRNRRKLAKLPNPTFTYRSSSYLFYVSNILKIFLWQVCSQIVDDQLVIVLLVIFSITSLV